MEHPPTTENSGAQTAEAPEMSLVSRMVNMFATPGEVFDSFRGKPASAANWLAPAILLMVVGWIGSFLVFSNPAIDQQLKEISAQAVEKQIEKSKMPPEQAEQVRAVAEKYGSVGTKIAAYAGPPVSALATPFIWGLILWLAGKLAFKVDIGYMKAVEIIGAVAVVAVLEAVVRTLLILVTGNVFAGPGVVLLVLKDYDPQNPVHGIYSLLNVMVLWILGLRALGLARLTGGSFLKAAVWVFGIWAGYNGFLVGIGALMQAIFNR